ncbi:MAG: DUF3373 domain-containing protein, partial [Campylobacterales bacterium]|nr:DUF3373 domain-containing protein [Campylobacterales bacterium]
GFALGDVTGIEGMNFKICGGRGYSNAYGKYNYYNSDFSDDDNANQNDYGTPIDKPAYSHNKSDTPDMDMIGFIWKAYDDSQYKVSLNYAKAVNMLGIKNTTDFTSGFQDVGDMTTSALTFEANGIGDEINDFLDDAKFFISYAQSKTDPKEGVTTQILNPQFNPQVAVSSSNPYTITSHGMLGSTKSETGSSIYAGFNWKCAFVDGMRIGVEYNKGDKYWRSFTYGEDTLIGSKLAARGTGKEIYINKELVGKYLTMQIRHTQIDYDYTGSDMFFGATGTPTATSDAYAAYKGFGGMDPVKSATDTRVSIRYRY